MQEVSGSIPLTSTNELLRNTVSSQHESPQYASSRSSRGLGHNPFTVVTGVRIPYGTPAPFRCCEKRIPIVHRDPPRPPGHVRLAFFPQPDDRRDPLRPPATGGGSIGLGHRASICLHLLPVRRMSRQACRTRVGSPESSIHTGGAAGTAVAAASPRIRAGRSRGSTRPSSNCPTDGPHEVGHGATRPPVPSRLVCCIISHSPASGRLSPGLQQQRVALGSARSRAARLVPHPLFKPRTETPCRSARQAPRQSR